MTSNDDPRALRSRQRMLEAIREILFSEGAQAITHQHVADIAGVGRATVYRHWASADDMVYALLDENPFQLLDAPSNDSLEVRLTTWLRWITTLLSDPQRRSVILHVLSRTDSDERASRLRLNRVSDLVLHLDNAIGDTGNWRSLSHERKVDGITMLVGPLMMRVLLLTAKPSDDVLHEVVQRFLVWLDQQSPELPTDHQETNSR